MTCKNHLWFYINEGNDVTTADQMKAALLFHGCVNGVRVTVVKGQTSPLEKSKIPGVNKLSNFEFGDKGIRARRAYRIDEQLIVVKDARGEVHSCKIQLISGALHSV